MASHVLSLPPPSHEFCRPFSPHDLIIVLASTLPYLLMLRTFDSPLLLRRQELFFSSCAHRLFLLTCHIHLDLFFLLCLPP